MLWNHVRLSEEGLIMGIMLWIHLPSPRFWFKSCEVDQGFLLTSARRTIAGLIRVTASRRPIQPPDLTPFDFATKTRTIFSFLLPHFV
jgi:hypothetical protein